MELWQADEQLKAAVYEMRRQPTSAAHIRAVFEMELAELGLPERDEDVVQPPVVAEQKRNDDTSELTISPNALEEFEKRNPENPAAMQDGTKGKSIAWRSEPILKNILNRFVISADGELGQVIAHKSGVGGCTLVVAFEHQVVLRYLPVENLVGWRVFNSKRERDASLRAMSSTNVRLCPAEFVGVAA